MELQLCFMALLSVATRNNKLAGREGHLTVLESADCGADIVVKSAPIGSF